MIYGNKKYDPFGCNLFDRVTLFCGGNVRRRPGELPAHVPSAARRDTAPCSPDEERKKGISPSKFQIYHEIFFE